MIDVEIGFPFYPGLDGLPLQLGSIWYGVAGQNPVTAPVTVYWDAAGTQPASQPISVVNGRPSRNGSPALVYVSGDYSKLVQDARGRQITFEPAQSMRNMDALSFVQAGVGAGTRTALAKMRETALSVKDFLCGDGQLVQGDGLHDDTTGITAAITAASVAGRLLEWPAGTYLVTDTLPWPNKTQMRGQHESMGFEGGTKIIFAPTSQKNLFDPTGLPATLKDGYLFEGFYIVGNSANAAGNSDICLNVDNIIKSVFRNCRIQGFRTAIRCYATNGNEFQNMHPTDNFVQNVLYEGGLATTDKWIGGYNSNAPGLVKGSGSTSSIKFFGTTFEGCGTHAATPTTQVVGIDLCQETEGWEFIACYGEDTPNTNNVANAMFRVGLLTAGGGAPGACQLAITGGKWGGRNAGGVGAFLKTYTIDAAYVGGGAQISRYATVIDNSDAATLTGQVVLGEFFAASVSTIVADTSKAYGIFPAGSLSDPASRGKQQARLLGESYSSPATACTGAITTAVAWSLERNGSIITLKMPATTGVAAAAPSFTFGGAVPAAYRPSSTHTWPCCMQDNAANQTNMGVVELDYLTGIVTVYKTGARTINFTAAAAAGLPEDTTVSWKV